MAQDITGRYVFQARKLLSHALTSGRKHALKEKLKEEILHKLAAELIDGKVV